MKKTLLLAMIFAAHLLLRAAEEPERKPQRQLRK